MPFLRPCFTGNPVTLTSLLLLLLLAWDASGWDMWLAHLTGGYNGFPLRDNWWLTHAFHDGARRAAWMLVLCLCLAVWWPIGPFIRLSSSRRLQLAWDSPNITDTPLSSRSVFQTLPDSIH